MNIDLEREEASRAIQKGNKASSELTILDEAFALIRETALNVAVNSRPEEVALRERMIITVQTLEGLKTAICKVVDEGEAAKNFIAQLINNEDDIK